MANNPNCPSPIHRQPLVLDVLEDSVAIAAPHPNGFIGIMYKERLYNTTHTH